MYPKNDDEFRKGIDTMATYLPAPPGKYRVCMWNDRELSSSRCTFVQAMSPAFVGEFDNPEEAVRFATWRTIHGRRHSLDGEDYQVYDEKGRYLGGNPFQDKREGRIPEARLEAYRRCLEARKDVIPQSDTWLFTERLKLAFSLAADLHAGQFRKGTQIPYVSHLMAAASLVMENEGDEDEIAAALLHDAAEDQGGEETLKKIRETFGRKVADIVDGCTDTYEVPKPDWKPRKEKYLRRLAIAPPSVRLVAAADKLHNARTTLADYRTIGDKVWERFNAPKEELLWYHRSVTEALKKAGSNPLVEELDRVVGELERLASPLR
jgi:hypothetical protein